MSVDELVLIGKIVVNTLTTGSLGAVAWTFWNEAIKKWPALSEWVVLATRAAIAGLCLVLVAPVYAAAVAMLWLPQPTDWRGWVGQILSYAAGAYIASQIPHAVQKEREDTQKKALANQ